IEQIHASFLAVGCDVIETNTFRANRITLREYSLHDRVIEINCAAAALARRVADRFSTPEHPRFVAGSIGPSGMLPSSSDPVLSDISFAELADVFREQAIGLIEGGVDLLLIETSQDILEVKAAVFGIRQAFRETNVRLPIQAQVTLDTSGRMLLGTDIAAALVTLEALDVDVLGLNCSTGPEHMYEPARYLGEHSRLPVSIIPNAGLPINDGSGNAIYPLQPEPMANDLCTFVTEFGVNVVGGCCGTTPEHLAAIVAALAPFTSSHPSLQAGRRVRALSQRLTLTPDRDGWPRLRRASDAGVPRRPMASSAMRAVSLVQDPPPTLIGERINAQGSRKVKQLLLAEQYEAILEIARSQVEGGAHLLDVCVALTERADEATQMRAVVRLLAQSVEAPLVIDTTEPKVVQAALESYPGRAIVNSINLENGRERVDAVVPLVKAHGAAVIALTIDEEGMAHTAERKLAIARRIYDICVHEYGLEPSDLIFDTLTFTLTTGQEELRRSAIETMEGIRQIKRELPGVLTSLGVSNISFGLNPRARGVLNSVFLYHCVQAGLDMAIVNPSHITPYAEIPADQRELAEDLIFDRRPDALARYIAYFEQPAPEAEQPATEEPTTGMTPEERIHWQIVHRKKEGIEALLDEVLARRTPVEVLNEVLLPAMKDVGDRFGAGELILPFVLQSAEVMKRAVAHVERFLERRDGASKGTVVLATVYGDVHDIGKNLVKTILSNNGYVVHDLGKQVPVNVIIDKAVEVNATAIGLSALLVSTSKQMPLCVQELHRRGLKFPVLIGGAAINRRFGRRILFVEEGVPYEPGVFYCKDAFEGLAVMDALVDKEKRAALLARIVQEAWDEVRGTRPQDGETATRRIGEAAKPRGIEAVPIPKPPFWGPRVLRYIPLAEVFPLIDRDELFRLSWGAKNAHGETWEALRTQFEQRLARMEAHALAHGWLRPQAVYGYFPCQSEGDELIVYAPDSVMTSRPRAIARFTFPRQEGEEGLCIADYFMPVDSGQMDVVAFQVVTVGPEATERFDALQAAGDYSEAYYTHGLAVQTAEATAEWLHRRIKQELGIGDRGKRYSWGYPACPDLEDHAKVFQLLPAERELGMSLTAAFQLVPEQSTAAIVVHHPQARYFSVGGSRVEQLLREQAKAI
ncbi:MAG: homocysteine S-methyltransferase family protein, partial [Anaerolineae bacterium]|nr:homocysteine S-methyltransferase family protein [Anaerolineae bacterium]